TRLHNLSRLSLLIALRFAGLGKREPKQLERFAPVPSREFVDELRARHEFHGVYMVGHIFRAIPAVVFIDEAHDHAYDLALDYVIRQHPARLLNPEGTISLFHRNATLQKWNAFQKRILMHAFGTGFPTLSRPQRKQQLMVPVEERVVTTTSKEIIRQTAFGGDAHVIRENLKSRLGVPKRLTP
ncbi:MAG: hypothetical protein LQ349_008258, partial [Xanthoria aureola]